MLPNYKIIENLSGYSGAKVVKILDQETDNHYVIKYGSNKDNVNAVLVSQFLRQVTNNINICINNQIAQFYTPHISIEILSDGHIVQKQEFLPDLQATIKSSNSSENLKIQGLVSLDNIKDAAKLGCIFQFLMLADNISHNIRLSGSKFCIFDFDHSLMLGGECETSNEGIFNDKVKQVGHAFNNYFLDILELICQVDKYHYINFSKSVINPLNKQETWFDFFEGIKEGLILIQQNITKTFITNEWGKGISIEEPYITTLKNLYTQRLEVISKELVVINDILNEKRIILDIHIQDTIVNSLQKHKDMPKLAVEIKNSIGDWVKAEKNNFSALTKISLSRENIFNAQSNITISYNFYKKLLVSIIRNVTQKMQEGKWKVISIAPLLIEIGISKTTKNQALAIPDYQIDLFGEDLVFKRKENGKANNDENTFIVKSNDKNEIIKQVITHLPKNRILFMLLLMIKEALQENKSFSKNQLNVIGQALDINMTLEAISWTVKRKQENFYFYYKNLMIMLKDNDTIHARKRNKAISAAEVEKVINKFCKCFSDINILLNTPVKSNTSLLKPM